MTISGANRKIQPKHGQLSPTLHAQSSLGDSVLTSEILLVANGEL